MFDVSRNGILCCRQESCSCPSVCLSVVCLCVKLFKSWIWIFCSVILVGFVTVVIFTLTCLFLYWKLRFPLSLMGQFVVMCRNCAKKFSCKTALQYLWLGGVVVRTLESWLSVVGSIPSHYAAWLFFWDRWPSLAGKLSWDITTTQVNSALHPSGVAKLSTSFGWGKGWKVTAVGWHCVI